MVNNVKIKFQVSEPSLTSPFIKPYYQCVHDKISQSDVILLDRSVQSLQMATQRLKDELTNIPAGDDEFQIDDSFRRNGFKAPEDYVVIGGDGVVSICICMYQEENDKQEIITCDHTTQEKRLLGYLPLHGYYDNFGLIGGRWGCCVREPGILCQLSPSGDLAILLGPREFAHAYARTDDAPVLLVYHIPTAKLLLEKNCKKLSFVKCDPIGISICPASVAKGEYRIVHISKSMEVYSWNARTERVISLQLESVSPCRFNSGSSRNPSDSCIKFSPDGRCLSVMCYVENETNCACVILNSATLEALCWMAFDEYNTWFRWLFPIFSACGTKIALSTYRESSNKYDLTKYLVVLHQLPIVDGTLKFLCRNVILQRVHPSLINQLPLPSDLIDFLTTGNTHIAPVSSMREKVRDRCVLI